MKIAFDLDGVLCDIDVVALNTIGFLKQEGKEMELWYYRERRPLLNPYLFLTEDDEFIIVTARKKHLYSLTKRWVDKYFPGAKLYLVNRDHTHPREIAKEKMQILRKENVKIYFDDNEKVIEAMRVLNEMERISSYKFKEINFIQYGGRLQPK